MFEISQLKEMKLPELQDIAKKLNVSKFRSLKKLDLVYQILDKQAADPKAVLEVKKEDTPAKKTTVKTEASKKPVTPKPKRARVSKPTQQKDNTKQPQLDLKPEVEVKKEASEKVEDGK